MEPAKTDGSYCVILKYLVDRVDGIIVQAGDPVHVEAQRRSDGWPTLWVRHRITATGEFILRGDAPTRYFIVATGSPHPEAHHVGSAVCANGALVWHVMAEPAVPVPVL